MSSPGVVRVFISSALGSWFKVLVQKSLNRSYSLPRYMNTYIKIKISNYNHEQN